MYSNTKLTEDKGEKAGRKGDSGGENDTTGSGGEGECVSELSGEISIGTGS